METDRALGFWTVAVDGVSGEGECLVAECDRVSIWGVLIREREWGSGISVGMIGVFFGFCGRGINWDGLC